jgi:hypothetical protein
MVSILLRSLVLRLTAIAAAMLLVVAPACAQSALTAPFNHFSTGFPLTGTHVTVLCANCHVNGRFKNTPTLCVGCHNTMTAPGEPQSHPRTTNRCGNCHLTSTWRDLQFIDHTQATGPCATCHNGKLALGKPLNHVATAAPCGDCHHNTVSFAAATPPADASAASGVTAPANPPGSNPGASVTSAPPAGPAAAARKPARPGTHPAVINGCADCHNGVAAGGKQSNHVVTKAPCESCHKSTVTFAGALMNHAGLIANCAGCHNGRAAPAKPANHIITNAPCESCHRSTVAFAGARIDHTRMTAPCASCHNGGSATGKPPDHILTNAPCDTCHRSTATFAGAQVDHTRMTAPCANCHNGTTAQGRPPRHFLATLPCESCHRTANWIPASYRHTSPAYVNHGTDVSCSGCHVSNAQVVSWKFPAFRPNCAGCHVDKYRPMSHLKFERPVKVYYTIAELRDCTGACHTFADNTEKTIVTRHSGVHQALGGGW